jgi:hypothetical protein
MCDNFGIATVKWFCIICAVLIWAHSVKAGTILLLGAGLGTPGSVGPPPTCDGAVSLAEGCSLTFGIGIQ